ncbi:MAG: hypothetical protein HYX85_00070 [Chloroflexi bacterium]|nr:hypothetical protein [Chloroflexota bacterium]
MTNSYMNGYRMQNEFIETKGYKLSWPVATDGYEWCNEDDLSFDSELHNFVRAHETAIPRLFHYDRDALFYVVSGDSYSAPPTSLYDRPPALIDTQPPWLVRKGSLDLAQKQALGEPGLSSYQFVPTREYQPLDLQTLDREPLHREFAALDTNNLEEEVLRFAGKYGELGRPVPLWSPEENPVRYLYVPDAFRWNLPPGKRALVDGESLFRWRGEVEKMGVLLALWDLAEKEQAGKLGQLIHWLDNGSVDIRFKWRSIRGKYEVSAWDGKQKVPGFGHHSSIIASQKMLPGFFSEYRRGDFIGPARWFLGLKINLHLRGISPVLFGFRMSEITYFPKTLLDALWLLFALEVAGTSRTCWYCRKPLQPTRKDNVYCSNNCKRMAYYYDKQRKGGTR